MKLEFDPIADALYLEISDHDVERSEQIKPGVILDYDANGNIVGVEVLSVSERAKDSTPLKAAA
ncbi:MAG: DUF2283 domain-containing protein [Sulfuritalea sp.]|nr:DUF2283 domain-containing protein [Sulfuritalea sp.]